MMRSMSLSEIVGPMRAQLFGADAEFSGVSIDSRTLREGELFFALSGEQFDGHSYLSAVERSGACAAVVKSKFAGSLPMLQVADTQRALGHLGGYNRGLFKGRVFAVTGSSGKTTAKSMLHAVLSMAGHTLATEGNFNNEIGVPLTLLRLQSDYKFAVVEMGAAREGDIAWLCEIGAPQVSILLNAMPAHLSGFGDVETIARTKGEILDGLGKGDVAVINAAQPWADQWRERAGSAQVISFAVHGAADVSATAINTAGIDGVAFTAITPAGDCPIELQLAGEHNVANALAVIAAALSCGMSLANISEGLANVAPVAGRLSSEVLANGAVLIDDCYNANPGSVRAAIDVLMSCTGRRNLVLGGMKELGANSDRLHAQVGEYARAAGVESLWAVGDETRAAVEAFGSQGRFFGNREDLLLELESVISEQDIVLVKGSRSAGMEMIVAGLQRPSVVELC